jgi:hypothetical protein
VSFVASKRDERVRKKVERRRRRLEVLSSLGGKGEGGCARASRSLDSFSRWARGECWSNFCAENSLFFGCLRGARVGKEQVNASPCFFFPFHLLEQACDEREVRRWLEGGKLFSSCNAIHGHKHAGLYEDEEENGRARVRMSQRPAATSPAEEGGKLAAWQRCWPRRFRMAQSSGDHLETVSRQRANTDWGCCSARRPRSPLSSTL